MLFFRHTAQNSLDNRQVNYARFAQSDEKIGGASAALSSAPQSLTSVVGMGTGGPSASSTPIIDLW